MDATFKEILCPNCKEEMRAGNTSVGNDVITQRVCDNCEQTITIIIPNKDYNYEIKRIIKTKL